MKTTKFFIVIFISCVLLGCSCQNDTRIVVIGNYLDLLVEKEQMYLTEEELQDEIRCELLQYSEEVSVVERGIQENDVVRIQYTIYKDDSIYQGYEDIEEYVCVGENCFNKDIEQRLLELKAGDTFKEDVYFGEEYGYTLFAGQYLTYEVTVVEVVCYELPQLTSNFLIENYNLNSEEEFYDYVKTNALKIKEELALTKIKKQLIQQIIDTTVFDDAVAEQCDMKYNEIMNSYRNYAELYGIEVEDVLDMYSLAEDTVRENAEFIVKSTQVCRYIYNKEELKISRKEKKEIEERIYQEYGYDSAKQYIEDNGKEYFEDEVMYEFVSDYVYNNAMGIKR